VSAISLFMDATAYSQPCSSSTLRTQVFKINASGASVCQRNAMSFADAQPVLRSFPHLGSKQEAQAVSQVFGKRAVVPCSVRATTISTGRGRADDAAKTNVAGRRVDRLALARRWPVAQAVVRSAEMRTALHHPAWNLTTAPAR